MDGGLTRSARVESGSEVMGESAGKGDAGRVSEAAGKCYGETR
jgi:hypothetical protein